jgi:hypothetical protein
MLRIHEIPEFYQIFTPALLLAFSFRPREQLYQTLDIVADEGSGRCPEGKDTPFHFRPAQETTPDG